MGASTSREWRRLNARFDRTAGRPAQPVAGARIHALSGAARRLAARRRSTRASSSASRPTRSRRRAKASSETSWLNPTKTTRAALQRFRRRACSTAARSAAFLDSFEAFARRAALLGALNSLTQLALKATMPGVPDFYQGTELWDLSLVDPDNRRPVDFAARAALLAATADAGLARAGGELAGRADQARADSPAAGDAAATPARIHDGGYRPLQSKARMRTRSWPSRA